MDSLGNTITLPSRPIFSIDAPGVWTNIAGRHSPEISTKIRKDGLETVRRLLVKLPQPVVKDEKDPIQAIYVSDKEGLIIGYHKFTPGEQEIEMPINGNINYMQIYVECQNHGLWQKNLRLS